MFIFSKKHFEFKTGDARVDVPAQFAGEVPDGVKNDWLFDAAVKCGDIVLSEKTAQKVADEKPVQPVDDQQTDKKQKKSKKE